MMYGVYSTGSSQRNEYLKRKLKRQGIDVDKMSYLKRVRELTNARKAIEKKSWYRNYYGV